LKEDVLDEIVDVGDGNASEENSVNHAGLARASSGLPPGSLGGFTAGGPEREERISESAATLGPSR
jgi:hypothetical protein